jgi:hypothetical protein
MARPSQLHRSYPTRRRVGSFSERDLLRFEKLAQTRQPDADSMLCRQCTRISCKISSDCQGPGPIPPHGARSGGNGDRPPSHRPGRDLRPATAPPSEAPCCERCRRHCPRSCTRPADDPAAFGRQPAPHTTQWTWVMEEVLPPGKPAFLGPLL